MNFKREAINPQNDWGAAFEMNQAESITGSKQHVHFSGQTAIVADPGSAMGVKVLHPHNQREQLKFTLDMIEGLLVQAGMQRKNIVQVRFFTTDMKDFLEHYSIYADWIRVAHIRPTQSVLGIKELVFPELKLEIEVTAAA
jgi:enamine deaminase RidA (YjgF/YER057c/UK114 family)